MAYRKLATTLIISFLIMYGVMFLNVYSVDHIFLSKTRLYMALLMVSPMAVVMIGMMKNMYTDRKRNIGIITGGIIVFVLSIVFLRQQTFISDKAYMRAMIPHHSSAILTSKHADIRDPEVRRLADQIIKSQEDEIAQMKGMLSRLNE